MSGRTGWSPCREYAFEAVKIGAGPPPLRVGEGWLLIHHGVSGTLAEGWGPQPHVRYSAGAMLLDPDDPGTVLARTPSPLLEPLARRGTPTGTVPNVVFPTAIEDVDGQRFVFYGMADSSIGVARLDSDGGTMSRRLTAAAARPADRREHRHPPRPPPPRPCHGHRPRRATDQPGASGLPHHHRRRHRSNPGTPPISSAAEPSVGVLWVYANYLAPGSYQVTGGGTYDAANNTYGQGAYDADDISRAAVVYLQHWVQFGDQHSRDEAYQLLRGLTYLQTASGPNAGNVVLWMQPDGSLNPTPTPADSPNPSDSGASYWLARTIWALGEGYADFRGTDPAFAAFLQQRLDLAIGALDREVLTSYGQYQLSNGLRVPAWLITGDADASSEAVLGLAAYVQAGGGAAARTALAQLADGIADMGSGTASTWPYGAILPSATSRSQWHPWAAQMATALADAATALHQPGLLSAAVADTAVFTPHLLTATGPDNLWGPAPVDSSQIAYGAGARVLALLAVATATHSAGLRQLAGIAAGWFFGQNPAGIATYNPATGATDDGINANGTVNLNSGAESTIFGLLTMEALDANPDVAAIARASASVQFRDGQQTVEAEAASLTGPAEVVQANPVNTGESQWSGGAYVQLATGSTLSWTIPADDQPRLVQAIVNRVPGPGAVSDFTAGTERLGAAQYGGGGAQGISPAPDALLPVTLPGILPATATQLTASTLGGTGQLDAILLTPLIAVLITTGDGRSVALLNSEADTQGARTSACPAPACSRHELRQSRTPMARHHQHGPDHHRARARRRIRHRAALDRKTQAGQLS